MKAYILTEGGKRIGFGHITRCLSLYEAFKERNIIPGLLINADRSVLSLPKGKSYRILDWVNKGTSLFELINKADIIVIDSYLAPKSIYDRIFRKFRSKLLVMIDDYNRIAYPPGIVVCPSIYAGKINYPEKQGLLYLKGKEYILLRKAFWKIPRKIINKKVGKILITFGGINHSDLTSRITKYFKDRFDARIYLVDPRKNKIDDKKMLNLMLMADICISGGGQILNELARVGLAAACICLADNQRLNLEGWHKEGFIEYIGKNNDSNLLAKLEASINTLSDLRERAKRSILARTCVDGRGAKRIVSEIIRANKRGYWKSSSS